jgi:hypothetical protein
MASQSHRICVAEYRHVLYAVQKNNSQNTAQSVWRPALGWTAGVLFLVGTRDFSLHTRVQTGYEVHLASYVLGTGNFLPGDRASGTKS